MIILQLKEESTFTDRVLFQWLGMNISMETIVDHVGERYLYVRVENAKAVAPLQTGNWARWTISKVDTEQGAAGASITCNGSASDATSKSTGER